MSMLKKFMDERIEIGAGMVAKVYSWNGYAYKCFEEGYPKEWIDYEYSQQNEVCKSGLPVPHYYESEFPGTIKMDLISGNSMFERFEVAGKDAVMKDFMTWFKRIHEEKGLKLHSVSKYLRKQIDTAPITEEQRIYAKQCFQDVETEVQEEELLCHMDYHVLNVMYEDDDVRIIDWVNAKNGKPIWDYARTYVIFYEYAAGLKRRYMKQVMALEGYSEEIFWKAVYVNAVYRLNEHDTKRVRQLMQLIEGEK
ncbi:MAG: phosphotransferase [Roseburia sp.]